jgi:hypothetical protein
MIGLQKLYKIRGHTQMNSLKCEIIIVGGEFEDSPAIHRGTIHREKIKIQLDEFLILLDDC